MSLVTIIVFIILMCLAVWVINQLPIDGKFKQIAYVVLVVFTVLYVMQAFGLINAGLRLR